MTVAERMSESPIGRHPLRRGASPATIRSWLLPGDADRFVTAYEAALDEARQSQDLAVVHETVEHWRRLAALQADPDAFRETVRRLAEFATGTPPPGDEPLDVTRARDWHLIQRSSPSVFETPTPAS